ncbi:hypothetical protein [Pelagibius sp.]|uniref:hypothetical protein n=1 Tax=Pelagibius sp. TaxID=1931238 RepID=UPI00262A61C5|nr:hypothetical protein [Pelagibius sp.]
MSDDDFNESQLRRLKRLLSRSGGSDYELDLTGLDLAHSIGSIDRMVERQRFRSEERRVTILIDPATPNSGETQFGHLGRHLLDLLRRGLIARMAPLDPDRAAGFDVELPAGKEPPLEETAGGETAGGEPNGDGSLVDLAPEPEDDPTPGGS